MQKEDDIMHKNETTSVQKTLNKLISEELIAGMFYNGCILAVGQTIDKAFYKLFTEIASDELNDHLAHLKAWAVENDYHVPFKLKEYEKYANKSYSQLNRIKLDEKVIYYIDEAIKSEEDAIKSYEEAMEDDNIPYDLYAILQQNYYDEVEHLDKLTFIRYAYANNTNVI